MNPVEIKANGDAPLGSFGFNVPSLLGVAYTAPYFHDGSAATLTDVFERHGLGGAPGTMALVFLVVMPSSRSLPCFTSETAFTTIAGVTAFSDPTSSSFPQIQPQPCPRFQPRTAGSCAMSTLVSKTARLPEVRQANAIAGNSILLRLMFIVFLSSATNPGGRHF